MWFGLVPVTDGADIVLPLEQSKLAYPNLLQRDTQILLEEDRVHDMPAIEAAHGRHVAVEVVVVLAVNKGAYPCG